MSAPPAVVTGATGWLGSRLVRALTRGLPDSPGPGAEERRIRRLVRRGVSARAFGSIPESIETVEGDLTEPRSLGPLFSGLSDAVVYHCAGVVHPRVFTREFYRVNTRGTAHVLQEAIKAKARRFIYVSSSSPFGFNPSPHKPFDESSPYNPHGEYGRSKMLAEKLVSAASKEIETVIVRAPWFYGPGQPMRQTRFFSMIKRGAAPVAGKGDNLRSMAYVDNLCQGLMLCERVEEAKGRAYWIADREPYTFIYIIDAVRRVLESDFKMEVKSGVRMIPWAASEAALLADRLIQGAGFYSQDVHVLSELNKDIACSTGKAERELGYKPGVELEEGMRKSIEWLLDQGVEI